jgi:hypothetical protein
VVGIPKVVEVKLDPNGEEEGVARELVLSPKDPTKGIVPNGDEVDVEAIPPGFPVPFCLELNQEEFEEEGEDFLEERGVVEEEFKEREEKRTEEELKEEEEEDDRKLLGGVSSINGRGGFEYAIWNSNSPPP